MKKSFMTRALAMGLSLAMAFSMSAATNVTTAAAAAKPAMKSSKMAVKVGDTKGYNATAATQKAYKITKTKVSAANKDKAKITVKSNKKGIKVTGLKAVSKMNVRIYFKNNKTKKTTSKVTTLKVKEVITKQAIVNAEATGVKKVTLTMAKDVASVASPVAITVKKDAANRPCKATAEGKTITLEMDAKLTQGSYSVSITGLETETLTKDFAVEKDETLTSYYVSDNLVAFGVSDTTAGSIKYAALNQYGEKMNANEPTVTCSFGKIGRKENNGTFSDTSNRPSKPATATANGTITVYDINAVLAIPGTKGTVVLVGDTGVTCTKEITYNTFAKAAKAEVIGLYHKNSAELKTLKEGAKLNEYELLLKFTDQYDEEMGVADLKDTVSVTISGGLTKINRSNIKSDTFGTRTYKGADYAAVPLAESTDNTTAVAGEATLIVTNNFHGMLINDKITVAKSIIIKSMTITNDNGIYAEQDNEMGYEFIDADGNSVNKYADLVGCSISFPSYMRMERKDDGTAKIVVDGTQPAVKSVIPNETNSDKSSGPLTATVFANRPESGEYLVKTFTWTAYEKRIAKGVTGVKADVATSISAKSKKNLTIKNTDIELADQYSNKVTDADTGIFNKYLVEGEITGTTTGTSVCIASNGAFECAVVNNEKIVATPAGVGTATVYLKYKYDTSGSADKNVTATASNYDAKFTLTAYDTGNVDVSSLFIDSIFDGDDATTTEAALSLDEIKPNVVVKATVGGEKTLIPADQYIVLKNENNKFSKEDDAKEVKTKTAKLTVQVTTWDSANTPIETILTKEYTVSRADSKLFKVTDAKDATAVSGNDIASQCAVDFEKQFTFKDQYGTEALKLGTAATSGIVGTLAKDSVTYKIDMVSAKTNADGTGATKNSGYTISANGSYQANITFSETGTYVFKVTVKAPNGSTKTAKFTVKNTKTTS